MSEHRQSERDRPPGARELVLNLFDPGVRLTSEDRAQMLQQLAAHPTADVLEAGLRQLAYGMERTAIGQPTTLGPRPLDDSMVWAGVKACGALWDYLRFRRDTWDLIQR